MFYISQPNNFSLRLYFPLSFSTKIWFSFFSHERSSMNSLFTTLSQWYLEILMYGLGIMKFHNILHSSSKAFFTYIVFNNQNLTISHDICISYRTEICLSPFKILLGIHCFTVSLIFFSDF